MNQVVDVPGLVSELRAAQPEWERLGVEARTRWLRRYAEWLLDNQERIVAALAADTGKPTVEARIEFTVPVDLIKYSARHARGWLRPGHPAPPNLLNAMKQATVTHRPYPVVAVITPWNFPLGLSLCDAIPALLAGAAVVVKPASATPRSVIAAIQGWAEIGAPPVFRVLHGPGSSGAALVEQADFVQFTGSTEVGIRIAERCAQRLVPCGLELGGKDAAIVLADADLDLAVRGIAWGALANAGQMCTSVERVYVESAVYPRFVERLSAHVGALRRGADVAPLVTTDQFDLVRAHLVDALAAGARVAVGGNTDRDAKWVQPTVLTGVDHTMAVVCEETFGPLIPVIEVADADEAVALANSSRFGLSASVWTRDTRRGRAIAARLDAGSVNINDSHANVFFFAAPMDGWKQSGLGGRFGGADSVLRYCRPQTVTAPRAPIPYQRYLLWFPYTPSGTVVLGRIMRALAATGRRRWGW
ncbi:aldehyde dehydrogenase family protein [Nocardia nepalensis]|uniref:aldehyde dehydrogenase family protein n=1 Tax=Nocardia nepalensis TaxID=3375448 RepID=UPI003B67B5A6